MSHDADEAYRTAERLIASAVDLLVRHVVTRANACRVATAIVADCGASPYHGQREIIPTHDAPARRQ